MTKNITITFKRERLQLIHDVLKDAEKWCMPRQKNKVFCARWQIAIRLRKETDDQKTDETGNPRHDLVDSKID